MSALGLDGAVRQSLAGFRSERQADWLAFEALLDRVERRSPRALSEEELLALPRLYRSTLSSLSVARATSLDQAMIAYLEALSLRGYFYLYGARQSLRQRIAGFILHDWPEAVRDLWRETLAASALMLVGALAGFSLVRSDASWFGAIIPQSLAGGRGPEASSDVLLGVLYDGGEFLSGFAVYLFTHNVQVAILAFALGFALGVPTVLLMVLNGCILGAMFEIYWAEGLGAELGGWLFIHGSTELFAIALAGAAGLRIGTGIAFPGALPRLTAAARAGRISGSVMIGVTVMLLIAGLLEGIGRQTIQGDVARYLIGGGMLAVWLVYFYAVRVRRDGS